MKILGIETSCDDTAASVVEDGHKVLSNVVWNQNKVHEKFGGVVPELAARSHVEAIGYAVEDALAKAGVTLPEIDAVAVNHQRGLLRSLVVGVAAAKAIALGQDIPLIGVHHVEGHIHSAHVDNPDVEFPVVCLTVSGGHNYLLYMRDHGDYDLIGNTLDDAGGEAYDKVARFLDLGFPGGPVIDKMAKEGNPEAYDFPRPMLHAKNEDGSPNYNFSFSGLKTAVINAVKKDRAAGREVVMADVAASFAAAVVDVLVKKTVALALEKGAPTVTAVGGVSLNPELRRRLTEEGEKHGFKTFFPDKSLCTDNAAMIASLGYYKYKDGHRSKLDIEAFANAPIGAKKVG